MNHEPVTAGKRRDIIVSWLIGCRMKDVAVAEDGDAVTASVDGW